MLDLSALNESRWRVSNLDFKKEAEWEIIPVGWISTDSRLTKRPAPLKGAGQPNHVNSHSLCSLHSIDPQVIPQHRL